MKSLCVQLRGLGSVDSDVIYNKSAAPGLFWTKKDKKSFIESDHLEGDVDIVKLIKMILNEENKRKKKYKRCHIPMRPDHGHCLLDDQKKELNPGYSVIGRMKGLAEIRGVIKTLNMSKLYE